MKEKCKGGDGRTTLFGSQQICLERSLFDLENIFVGFTAACFLGLGETSRDVSRNFLASGPHALQTKT